MIRRGPPRWGELLRGWVTPTLSHMGVRTTSSPGMTAVWRRYTTATILQSYVVASPFFPRFLSPETGVTAPSPFPQGRANTRGTCLTSLSQKTPLNKPGPLHKRPLEACSLAPGRSLDTGTAVARIRTLLLLHRLPRLSKFHGHLNTEPPTLNTYTLSQV